jgi:ribosomal protein S18 acetylase RimI-like enzyme
MQQFLQDFDQNVKGKFSYLPSRIDSMTVKSIDHVRIIDSNLDCDMFNIICCDGAPPLSSVSAAVDHFRSKKLSYAFWVGFQDEPPWLEKELLKLGLMTDEIEWAMVCHIGQNLPKVEVEGIQIKQVNDDGGIRSIIEVMNGIFPEREHPAISTFYRRASPILLSADADLSFFVGYEHHQPISLVSIYFDAGLASIFDVIVLPQMRGRGLGKMMTAQAMLEAKSRGFDVCVLTATNDAKHLYQKLGFADVKTMRVYTQNDSKVG